MRRRQRIYILLGVHAVGRGASGKWLHALVAHSVGRVSPLVKARPCWARMHAKGCGRVGPGADRWERARIPGMDTWDWVWILRASADAGANTSGANAWESVRAGGTRRGWVELGVGWRSGRVGPGANCPHARGCGHEHRVRARTEGE
jgi:hypothetical protein